MSQRVPRHTFDLCLLASWLQPGIEVNISLSGFLVVEDVFVLPSQLPELQNPAHFRVDQNDPDFLGLVRERVDPWSLSWENMVRNKTSGQIERRFELTYLDFSSSATSMSR